VVIVDVATINYISWYTAEVMLSAQFIFFFARVLTPEDGDGIFVRNVG
jgi:hypothetical protein